MNTLRTALLLTIITIGLSAPNAYPMVFDADPTGIDDKKIERFIHAARDGEYDKAIELIEQVPVNAVDNPWDRKTALHYAICNGHAAIVDLLIARNANVHQPDAHWRVPLTCAAGYGEPSIVQALITAKAAPDTHSSLLHALHNRHSAVVQILLEHGAPVDPVPDGRYTPLHTATLLGDHAMVATLLACARVDPNARCRA